MAYVYRYIDLEKQEVVYVGKVTKSPDPQSGYDPLRNRHEQHKREEWYKKNEANIAMQFVEASAVDADILETWLINYYDETGQLVNKGKCGWGESSIDLYPLLFGRWRNYGGNPARVLEEAKKEALRLTERLFDKSEGFEINLDIELKTFCHMITDIAKDVKKSRMLTRFNAQDEYKRTIKFIDTLGEKDFGQIQKSAEQFNKAITGGGDVDATT